MYGTCLNVGIILLVILVATFLVVWSANQAKGKLGKILGSIILVIGALVFLCQAYTAVKIGCLKGTCPMMSLIGIDNMPMGPGMQKKMQMIQGQQQPVPPAQPGQ